VKDQKELAQQKPGKEVNQDKQKNVKGQKHSKDAAAVNIQLHN